MDMDKDKVDGRFHMPQYMRLDIPVDIQRKFGIFKGWAVNYEDGKQKYLSIPEEQRYFPYVLASRVVAMFPNDATEKEVVESLEFLLNDLKRRWKDELNK